MPLDPDLIRVDLLKVKRKLYSQYPEGSKERQEFLISSKLSELRHLSQLLPEDSVSVVFEEHKNFMLKEKISISLNLLSGVFLSWLFYETSILHQVWFTGILATLFLVGVHVKHIYDFNKKMEPFRQEYEVLQGKIDKIKKELRDLQ
jgi:hypothetical protein